jgi:hypothetical protein
MYGFWRLTFIPAPSGGAVCVANGLETTTGTNAKKQPTADRTGTVHGRTSATSRRFSRTAAALMPVRTSIQRRSDPAWPLQKAASVYMSGSSRLECWAT